MTRRSGRRLVVAGALALATLTLAGSLGAAQAVAADTISTPTPTATPSAAATPSGGISASTSVGSAKPGEIITVFGSGWPARITIQASTCGNNAIAGASDCSSGAGGQSVTKADGTFQLDLPVGKPPKPCPCVVHIVSPDTTAKVDQPFEVIGQPTGPLQLDQTTRSLVAEARLTGSGPVTAWLGGKAQRTYLLTMRNTGNVPITNPGLTLTVGKGADPTQLLANPQVGSIQVGQTVVYRLPVTLDAPTFGQYRVKAYFSDLDTPVSVTTSTSSYPWLLFIFAWLLLQPLLLGLYKRRPAYEEGDDDPFNSAYTDLPPAAPLAPVAAGVFIAGFDDDPSYQPPPVAAPIAVGATTAVVPRAATALVPNYTPVFGVTDLRAYLDPTAAVAPVAIAPRIVLGGVVPHAPVNGNAPQ